VGSCAADWHWAGWAGLWELRQSASHMNCGNGRTLNSSPEKNSMNSSCCLQVLCAAFDLSLLTKGNVSIRRKRKKFDVVPFSSGQHLCQHP